MNSLLRRFSDELGDELIEFAIIAAAALDEPHLALTINQDDGRQRDHAEAIIVGQIIASRHRDRIAQLVLLLECLQALPFLLSRQIILFVRATIKARDADDGQALTLVLLLQLAPVRKSRHARLA